MERISKLTRTGYRTIDELKAIIPDGEPFFVLRISDICVPATLRYYATMLEVHNAQPEMIRNVKAIAAAIEDYWKDYPHIPRVPDIPEENTTPCYAER